MRGLKFVIETARSLNMPVSINISYGTNNGAHNGTSIFETYIDDIGLQWKTSITVATGNEGIAGHHASGVIASNQTVTQQFVVAEGLPSVDFSIWTSFVDGIGIEIIAPGGSSTGILVEGGRNFNFVGYQIVVAEGSPSPYTMDRVLYVDIIPKTDRLAAGKWSIVLHGGVVVDGRYNIWLPITEIVGLDTYFLTPDAETTLTLPSTAMGVISVGGYDSRSGAMADFSGRGHNRNSGFLKPDIVAPAVNIVAPVPGGGYGAFTGTSMAAPFVAGSVALMLEWGIVQENDPYLYGEKLKAYLLRGARRSETREYPNPSWGYGRLCLLDSFLALMGATTSAQGRGAVKMTELNQNFREQPSAQEKIMSNEYADIIVFSSPELMRVLLNRPEITVCQSILDSYIVLQVKRDELTDFLNELSGVSYEKPTLYGLMDQESLVASGITSIQNQPYLNLRGRGTLFGIIDTGIDYTNDVFTYEDNTSKIISIWDQTIPGDGPEGFCYGTEYTQEQINAALQLEDPFSLVPHRDEVGHGTFLSSVAVGRGQGNAMGAAPDADIVAVKLKPAKPYLMEDQMVLRDGALAYQDTDIIGGIQYIFAKARELNRPLALCLPFGTNHSELGGYAVLDQFITSASVLKGLALCVPAGNEGNRGHHYEGLLTQNEKVEEVEIEVAPGEKGFLVDIWNFVPDKISVGIVSPRGTIIERFPVRDKGRQETKLVFENTTVTIEYFIVESRTGEQRTMVRFLNPIPGVWTIVVYGDMIIDGRFHAWLPITGWIQPGTRFLNPSPDYTITSPGISHEGITIGAYNVAQNSIYIESGRGPGFNNIILPDIVAPGVNVGGLYPGNTEGSMTGTSIATAVVAGACLLILEWALTDLDYNNINTNKIRTYLARGARRRLAPNNVWGYGELDLVSTFEQLG